MNARGAVIALLALSFYTTQNSVFYFQNLQNCFKIYKICTHSSILLANKLKNV